LEKGISGILVGSIAMISAENNFRNHGDGRKYTKGTATEVARGQLRAVANTTSQLISAGVIESGFSEIYDGFKAKAKEIGGLKKDQELRTAYSLLSGKIENFGKTNLGDKRNPDQVIPSKSKNGSDSERVGGHPV
jgi:hypothetical protein